MMVSSAKGQVNALSDPHPILEHSAKYGPVCIIYSNHPLALSLIKDAVCSDPHLLPGVRSCSSRDLNLLHELTDQILILDTCSVENWAACLLKWQFDGGSAIALLSPELQRQEQELQTLYLGAAGALSFADLSRHLSTAIYAVAEGHLWFRRDVLNAYVKQTSVSLRKYLNHNIVFTTREKEIMEFLLQGLPNRTIAQRLAISERTTKFHVSNILSKLNLRSRKEFQAINSSSTILQF